LTNWFSIADISFVFQEIFLKMNSENHSYKILQNRIELDEAIGFLKKKYQKIIKCHQLRSCSGF
jgi:hypothetical protein